MNRICSVLAVTAVVSVGSIASAQPPGGYLPIYGGATFDPATGAYQGSDSALASPPMVFVNNAGVAAGTLGDLFASSGSYHRPTRWDGSGAPAMILETFGPDFNENGGANQASGINSAGAVSATLVVVGTGESRAVHYAPGATAPIELGHLGVGSAGGTGAHALAINDAGTIVGSADKWDLAGEPHGSRAVRWDAGGTAATELDSLAYHANGSAISEALAINNAGTAVGSSVILNASGQFAGTRAVRWDAGGTTATMLDPLPLSPDDAFSSAMAINAAGTIMGNAGLYNELGQHLGDRAVRWNAGGTAITALDVLELDANGLSTARAFAINAHGTIVGRSNSYGPAGEFLGERAVRWDAGGTAATELQPLATPPSGFVESAAVAINRAGIAVGFATDYFDEFDFYYPRPVYWRRDGTPVSIFSLIDPASGWTFDSVAWTASAISDTGWIAGVGQFDPDGPGGQASYSRHYLIHVPETAVLVPLDYVLTVEYRTPEVTGPLIDGFDPIPETFTAEFRLDGVEVGQTLIGLDQVESFQMNLPGGSPTVADLDHFQLALNSSGTPQSLTWGADDICTGDNLCGIIVTNNNFTLEITGTDPDSGEAFRYFWSESTNTFTAVPEPSALPLLLIVTLSPAASPRLRRGFHRRNATVDLFCEPAHQTPGGAGG
jgi:uncharacterized membrane protein